MEDLLEQLASRSPSKTNLRTRPNERECFMNGLQAETTEAEFANLLVLLCLLKYRYSHFTKAQLEVLRYSEEKMQSLTPTQFYKDVMRGDIDLFLRRLLELLVDRHKLIASIKYESGTRFWLFTEEDGVLFHYGKPYDFRAYRESKWRNVVELLCDMGLIQKVGKALKISKMGRSWLQKIK